MRTLRYLAHLLAAGVFIFGGMSTYREPAPRAAKARALGLPESHALVQFNAALMVAGGIALALDLLPRVAAALLAASLVPTTIVGHAFWTEQSPAARQAQQTQFLKNLAMLAALLLIVVEPHEREQRPA
jgi:uncharacterized membrane protein YphA (DoxX/SURF4 family)